MSKYEGLYTFDVDNHRYIPVGQSDGIIDCFKFEHESKEPLIKDGKIRKAVRAWAETNQSKFIIRNGNYTASDNRGLMIEFNKSWTTHMENGKQYTITELCGEEEE